MVFLRVVEFNDCHVVQLFFMYNQQNSLFNLIHSFTRSSDLVEVLANGAGIGHDIETRLFVFSSMAVAYMGTVVSVNIDIGCLYFCSFGNSLIDGTNPYERVANSWSVF